MTHQDPSLKGLLTRRWRAMGVAFALTLAGGNAAVTLLPKTYQSSAKLLVVRPEQRIGGLKLSNDALPELTGASHPLYTQIELMRAAPLLQEVITKLDLREKGGEPLTTEQLGSRILVSPITGTDLLEVRCTWGDPRRAQQVVEALCAAYLRYNQQYRREGVGEGLKYADEQLAAARARLTETERNLEQFKRGAGSVALTEEIRASVTDLSTLNSTIRTQEVELKSLQARVSSLRAQLGMSTRDALNGASLAQSPKLRSLQEQLLTAETSPLRFQGLAPDHPDMVALNERLSMLRAAVATEIRGLVGRAVAARPVEGVKLQLLEKLTSAETDLLALKASLEAAKHNQARLTAGMASLPERETKLTRLTREVEVASQVYQQLLQRREEARLAMSIAPSIGQLIQPANLPTKPSGPMQGKTVPILVLLSLAAAYGVGVLRDIFDRSVRPQDLAAYMPDVKVLASVPLLNAAERRGGELVVRSGASPRYHEAMMTLGFALEDHRPEKGGHVLALTSSLSGEGKSVTVANLALGLAEAGHRVLVVDADFCRPRQHALFGMSATQPGLAQLLCEDLPVAELIQTQAGIDVLPAGPDAVDFAFARVHRKLNQWLETWRQSYDFILLDMPPMALFATVARIAKQADGLLMLANLQRVTPATLLPALQQLQALRIPLHGMIVLNHSPARRAAEYSPYLIAPEGSRI